ncbi:hypothetical protein CR205_12535 [Alteribacter lacisalsi]|uniref:Uncharacterized protein n=1 Tax=Alteribacter lacisalsi TaxID=2045244 RepID=A0A2W0HGI7_9BACI|nr:hypothetical protein [Alteribacter lacisalsi]PYZ96535.1 hypothetical protein CR205_12535 [Alteribacter lacisalsi]
MTIIIGLLEILFWVVAFAAVVTGLTLIFMRFMKTGGAFAASLSTVTIAFGLVHVWTQHTTFDKAFSDQLEDLENFRNMTVEQNFYDEDGSYQGRARLTLEDENVMHQVLDDFEGLRLRSGNCHDDREYYVHISTRLNSTSFFAGESCVGMSHVRDSGRDHLQTLDDMGADESLEWEYDD